MRECGHPKTRLLAAKEILDRAYGKSAQTLQGNVEKPLAFDLSGVDEFTRKIAATVYFIPISSLWFDKGTNGGTSSVPLP